MWTENQNTLPILKTCISMKSNIKWMWKKRGWTFDQRIVEASVCMKGYGRDMKIVEKGKLLNRLVILKWNIVHKYPELLIQNSIWNILGKRAQWLYQKVIASWVAAVDILA